MQTIKSKKKKLHPDQYDIYLAELNHIIEEVPKLIPNKDNWDIEGDWDAPGSIHFVDADYQPLFRAYVPYQFRTIKIVNYGMPVVGMSFFKKHRYWVKKESDLSVQDKQELIQNLLTDLQSRIENNFNNQKKSKGSDLINLISELQRLKHEKEDWLEILENLSQYEFALSNYDRMHFYTTINFKYVANDEGDYANKDEHLLNSQRDLAGHITLVKHNIIFVDMKEIRRDHPNQHKTVDKYLNRFTLRTRAEQGTFYARRRADEEMLQQAVEIAQKHDQAG